MKKLENKLQLVTCPFLAIQGDKDEITSLAIVKKLQKISQSHDKKLLEVPGLYHAITEEPEIEELLEKVADWINQRV